MGNWQTQVDLEGWPLNKRAFVRVCMCVSNSFKNFMKIHP